MSNNYINIILETLLITASFRTKMVTLILCSKKCVNFKKKKRKEKWQTVCICNPKTETLLKTNNDTKEADFNQHIFLINV